jgi:hypothetical protein
VSRLQVRVLVEEGRANPAVQDRWGNTPLDEARRVGAALVVSYLEQALVKRREAEIAARAEQQRLLGAAQASSASVSNWRREQQLQQQLRSAEVTELYRLRQVQAQQVRQLSSSILGESREPQDAAAAAAAAGAAGAGAAATGPATPAASPSVPAGLTAAAGASAGPKAGPASSNAAVGELLQLAAQAQQALTLKVEEMELDLVETLQHKKEQLQQQDQPSKGNGKTGSGRSAGGSGNGSNGSRRTGNNVVSASKLQQPASQPVQAQPPTPKLQQ